MAVYVDKSRHKLGRMIMCHMVADSMDELLAMADTIGVDRKWFQPKSHPHFYICKANRAKAVKAGAKEVTNRELAKAMRRYERNWHADLDEREKLNSAAAAARKKEI